MISSDLFFARIGLYLRAFVFIAEDEVTTKHPWESKEYCLCLTFPFKDRCFGVYPYSTAAGGRSFLRFHIRCTWTHLHCYAKWCFLHWNTCRCYATWCLGVEVGGGWGVGGMFPFVALAHIFTATQHDVSCTAIEGRGHRGALFPCFRKDQLHQQCQGTNSCNGRWLTGPLFIDISSLKFLELLIMFDRQIWPKGSKV